MRCGSSSTGCASWWETARRSWGGGRHEAGHAPAVLGMGFRPRGGLAERLGRARAGPRRRMRDPLRVRGGSAGETSTVWSCWSIRRAAPRCCYLDFLRDLDIECVGTYGRWAYLRRPRDGAPFDLFSDIDSKIASAPHQVLVLACLVR
ncbi:MAG: DUF2812 domain-containing protein [Eggerthella lenta]